jgi:hypothetical protein
MMKIILIVIGAFFIALSVWFGLGRISWLQERRILLWTSRIVFCLLIAYITMVIVAFVSMAHRTPALPEPVITRGEFSFRLEYEIDGEHFVIEDTLISEFLESIRGSTFGPSSRRWRTTLQDNGEELRFLLMENDNVVIHFTTGLSGYFMGDQNAHEATRIESFPGSSSSISIPNQPAIVITGDGAPRRIFKDSENAHEILAEHGIILIDWEYAPPIRNSFNVDCNN